MRLDRDLGRYWEDAILRRVAGGRGHGPADPRDPGRPGLRPLRARARRRRGGVDGLSRPSDLFARDAQGGLDPIHVNDLGAYLVALTHYAVLYHQSPVGLPHRLRRADGSAATAPGAAAARLMQEVVWQVVTGYPKTGVAQRGS